MQTTKKKRRGKETLNTQTLRQKSSNGELRRQTHSVLKYSIDIQYKVTATSRGGRDGTISSTPTDGTTPLDLKFAVPKAIGGRGDEGHNPEQLFAAGYSGEYRFLPPDICIHVHVTLLPSLRIQRASSVRSKQLQRNRARKKSVHRPSSTPMFPWDGPRIVPDLA